MSTLTRPPYDPELKAALDVMPPMPRLTRDVLGELREAPLAPPIEAALEGRPVQLTDHRVPGYDGAEIVVSVFRRTDHVGDDHPAVFHIHGGGMIMGDRFTGADMLVRWVEEYDVVAASVEYRLAPEFPDPVPVEDAYAGLVWFAANASELGFDRARILIAGGSAGGGLTAGVALLARDRAEPAVTAQLLMCPMLDDRDQTVSTLQYDGVGIWDRDANRAGWSFLLGDHAGTDDVSIYAAPARATDLAGLPPAYIDCGSAEVFRDEAVSYATRIWEAGGQAELHVWAGGFHGYEVVATAAVSRASSDARESWVRRVLAL